jgi:hypothetical protein
MVAETHPIAVRDHCGEEGDERQDGHAKRLQEFRAGE